jgi:uncharacterized protein YhdP
VKRTGRRVFFWIIAGLLIAMGAGSILLLRSIALPRRYKGLIEAQLRDATGREVGMGRASLRFLGGIGIEFKDLVIKDWDGKADFVRTKGLILQLRLLPLLKRQLRWRSLILEQPSVYLRRSGEGSLNVWGRAKGSTRGSKGKYPSILELLSSFVGGEMRVHRGSVYLLDDVPGSGPTVVGVENLSIELKPISMDAPIPFHVQARQPNAEGPNGRVRIAGTIGPLPHPLDPSKIRVAAEVRAKNLNPLPFRAYYGPSLPMRGIGGVLDIHAHYEGDLSGLFRSWGQIRVKDVAFDYSQVFDTVLKPKTFVVDYDFRLNRRSLIISDVSLKLPEIEIRGRCALHEIRSRRRRRIEAFAATDSFRFDGVAKYIPYGILFPGFARVMREVTRGGKGRILSLRIKGLIEDFSALGDPNKADLIYGKMRLDGVAFPFARDFHPVEDISGWVTLKGGILDFRDLKGSYGRSKLNAREMTISHIYSSPRLDLVLDGEVDLGGIEDVVKPGASLGTRIPIDTISGRGSLHLTIATKLKDPSQLSYKGRVVLKGANLTIEEVHLPLSTVSGTVVFSNDLLRLIDLKGKMGNSVLWFNGQVKNPWGERPGGERLNLTLGGELDLGEWVSRLLSWISPRGSGAMASFSDISGEARLALQLRGGGDGLKGIRYEGRVTLREAVIRHPRMASPIRFLKGSIDFTPKTIGFSNMEAQVRGSSLRIEGSIKDYLPWKRSKVDLRVRSPRLDVGDFRLKKGTEGEWIWRGGIPLPESGRIALRVEEGKWRYTEFSNLAAHIALADGRLNLEGLKCEVKGGEVALTGWMDLAPEGEVAFGLNPSLNHVDAGRFFRDFDLQERVWITGAFHLWGSLVGRGHTGEEVRRSLEGKLRVRMEKGRIRRFHILSKVCSLLNVWQVFKGKLPELTGEGLPYNAITGDIDIAEGIAKTENLLVDSDAVKITIIGQADIARETLDVTMGLCPLGAVDTIVSSVPVVGRILAGEDDSVIAYYVEVKGDFSKPRVKHIPLKSMERGLIGMIRRALETPIHFIPGPTGIQDFGEPADEGEPEDSP